MPALDKVANRWVLEEQIGEGCFGQVFRGQDTLTNRAVAIKLEDKQSEGAGSLKHEKDILVELAQPLPVQGFTELYYYGTHKRSTCLVMEILGKSLADTIDEEGGKLDVQTTALVAVQALTRIEYLHSKGVIHRDIKPENFMWGTDRRVHHLYLIDFGLVGRYWNKGKHVPMRLRQGMVGTARYVSINVHRGYTQSRRDDCEAIANMLAFCLTGKLPWSGIKVRQDQDRNRMIGEIKLHTQLDALFEGFSAEFPWLMAYCRRLEYAARPDYDQMHFMFNKLCRRLGNVESHDLPWLRDAQLSPKSLVAVQQTRKVCQPDDLRRRPVGQRFMLSSILSADPPPMDTE